MTSLNELKKLTKENKKIRKQIDGLIGINYPNYSPLWELIEDLIETELDMEKLCGE